MMSAENIRPQIVFSDPDHDLGSFSLSPDEKKIVFSKELEDKSGELRILERETGRDRSPAENRIAIRFTGLVARRKHDRVSRSN